VSRPSVCHGHIVAPTATLIEGGENLASLADRKELRTEGKVIRALGSLRLYGLWFVVRLQ
jgi:hypothetical protein